MQPGWGAGQAGVCAEQLKCKDDAKKTWDDKGVGERTLLTTQSLFQDHPDPCEDFKIKASLLKNSRSPIVF